MLEKLQLVVGVCPPLDVHRAQHDREQLVLLVLEDVRLLREAGLGVHEGAVLQGHLHALGGAALEGGET